MYTDSQLLCTLTRKNTMEEYHYPIIVEGDWGPAKNLKINFRFIFRVRKNLREETASCNIMTGATLLQFFSNHLTVSAEHKTLKVISGSNTNSR